MKQIVMVLAAALCGSALAVNTWYVDAAAYGQTDADGSLAKPYGTIQEAIDAATTGAGDTILVKPGVYSNGVVSAATTGRYPCRVFVNKPDLVIRATDGRAATHIVGQLDSTGEKGIGPEAVACVLVNQEGTFVLDGFTVRDGRTTAGAGANDFGGGVYSVKTTAADIQKVHVYDCTVENCCSRGRMVGNVCVHRSLVWRNPYGLGSYQSAVQNCRLENSVLALNAADSEYSYGAEASVLVNCVVVGHWKALSGNCTAKNSVLAMNSQNSADNDTSSTYENCVFTEAEATRHHAPENCAFGASATSLFVAPAFNDYRTQTGSPAVDRASPAFLSELVPLPAGYVYKDYAGTTINTGASTIHAGVSQEVVTPAGGRAVFTGVGAKVEGVVQMAPTRASWSAYAYAERGPHQWAVAAVDPEAAPLWSVTDSGNAEQVRSVPDLKGNIWVMAPASGTTKTFTATLAQAVQVVGPEQSLQDAVNAADGALRTVIRCKSGRYATGSDRNARVSVSKPIHFVSIEPDQAVIVGESGTGDDGLGSGALRLVTNSNGSTAFSGFRLEGGRTEAEGNGALVYGGSNITFSDCLISDVYAYAFLAYAPVKFERCRLVDCGAKKSNIFYSNYGATLAGCLVKNPRVSLYYRLFGDTKVVNTTVVSTLASMPEWYLTNESTTFMCNSIVMGLGYRAKLADTANVCNSLFYQAERGASYIACVGGDPRFVDANGDDYHLRSESPALMCATVEPDYFLQLATSDFDGNPFCRDAKTVAGAYQQSVDTRDWYVNVVTGNDANTGADPSCPKRTLAAALASAISGETVYVAPGRYEDAPMTVYSTALPSRADVPAGVTLKSTHGAAETFIVGAEAVRCAYLGAGATLEGFTLTDGHGRATAEANNADYAGAAVSAPDQGGAVVRDCVITNCTAVRYLISNVRLERCRVIGNTATNSQIVRGGFLDNVLFAENRVNGNTMQYVNGLVNVTWDASNKTVDGSAITGVLDYHGGEAVNFPAINCLLFACQLDRQYAATNCVFTNPNVNPRTQDCNWRRITDLSKLQLDANYRPIIGAESALVDQGTNLVALATDASGLPRVSNGTVDIGALEADWRPLYAARLGHNVTVTEASPTVRLVDDVLTVGADGTLAYTWDVGELPCICKVPVTVSGAGTLTATRGGEVLQTLTAAAGVQELTFKGKGTEELVLAYAGDAGGSAIIGRGTTRVGLLVIFR